VYTLVSGGGGTFGGGLWTPWSAGPAIDISTATARA
jgi:hypothetical protein